MCCAFIEVLVRSNSQLEKENSKRTMRLHCSAVQVTVWGGAGVCDSWRGMRGLSGFRLFSPTCTFLMVKKTQLYKRG